MGALHIELMTDADRDFLARLAGLPEGAEGVAALRDRPELVDRVLRSERAERELLAGGEGPAAGEPVVEALSPFLVFAVAVHRLAEQLRDATFVPEWVGPRQRVPVLGGDDLRELLGDAARRLFLAALLASYTQVSSGTVWRSTPRGPRRQRYSELDLMRMAALLDDLPEAQRPAMQRRLGDLALFLAGVFPDYVASQVFRPIDLQRLGRAAALAGPAGADLAEALETRGGVGLLERLGPRWYLLAAQGAPGEPARALVLVAERFVDSRRALNLLADRFLFPVRRDWFPLP